jgi:hypothetical protein
MELVNETQNQEHFNECERKVAQTHQDGAILQETKQTEEKAMRRNKGKNSRTRSKNKLKV